jgi:hypothetical protein
MNKGELKENWDDYIRLCILPPPEPDTEDYATLQQTFYAGAAVVLTKISRTLPQNTDEWPAGLGRAIAEIRHDIKAALREAKGAMRLHPRRSRRERR